jgi:hypothetical protein
VTGQYPSWLVSLAASATMICLGVRLRLLMVPELKTRCPACGKLVWRGRTCSCTRVDAE